MVNRVYITEFSSLGVAEPGLAQIANAPAVAEQIVTISGASAQSAAFNASTRFIRVSTDSICSISIGSNPSASINTGRMPADSVEYFGVGPNMKLAAIQNT